MNRRPQLLLLLAFAVLTTGCATAGLPSAGFYGMRVETVQTKPDSDDLSLKVGLDFKVDNPSGVKLAIPEHSFNMEIDGAPVATTGTRARTDVKPRSEEVLTYEFVLGLGPDGLGRAFGKDAEFTFSAEADVDLPKEIIEGLGGSVPDIGGVDTSGLADQAAGVASTALSGIDLPTGDGPAKMRFGHKGRLKLAKPPKIQAPDDGEVGGVTMLGESEVMSLDNLLGELLGDLEGAGGPVVELLLSMLSDGVQQNVQLPVGEILQRLGVPSNLVDGALGTLNTFMTLNGKPALAGENSSIELPVQLPNLTGLINTVDPQGAAKIQSFTEAWTGFSANGAGEQGGMMIPTALPSGLRVAAPFQINNPNEFGIQTPSFRLAIVGGDGATVAAIGALPSALAAGTGSNLSTPAFRTVSIGAGAAQPMQLVSEINWDGLTGGLLAAAAGGQLPQLGGMTLQGEVTVDLGYGPITVPLNVPLAAPPAPAEQDSGDEAPAK